MIEIKYTKDLDLINHITRLKVSIETKEYLIKKDDQVIGVFQLQEMTKILSNIHIHVLPEYQSKGHALAAFNCFRKLLKTKNIKKLMATIPAKNKNMLKVLNSTDFHVCGIIQDGIIYNGELQDLLIFELTI